ncbi:hypothetical protein [Streptomyces sp. NPDC090445]|uniref:hypothetical protein n=1 Tax=Streptomyces sp. NPDC090445 TaxID=3365963 RepID=UPI0038088E20
MPETEPAAHVVNRDLPPGPRLVFVRNPGDDHRIVRRLAAVEGPGRLVVRPTPGGRTSDLALDILTATGRSPATLLADRTPAPEAWRQAAAWLSTDQIATSSSTAPTGSPTAPSTCSPNSAPAPTPPSGSSGPSPKTTRT